MPQPILVAYTLAALTTWAPLSSHAYYERREATERRYLAIAEAIAEAAEEDPVVDLEPGVDPTAQTAALLASIAARESWLIHGVVYCRRPGLGHAWGAFQYQGPRRMVCESLVQAARWALYMVHRGLEKCSKLEPRDRLSWYTDGRCAAGWSRSRERVVRAARWARSWPSWLFYVEAPQESLEASCDTWCQLSVQ